MGTDPRTTTKGLFQLLKNMKWSPPPNINYFLKKRCDWKYTFYRSRNNSHMNCTNLTIGRLLQILFSTWGYYWCPLMKIQTRGQWDLPLESQLCVCLSCQPVSIPEGDSALQSGKNALPPYLCDYRLKDWPPSLLDCWWPVWLPPWDATRLF